MNDVVADELGIRRILAAYCQLIDDGDFSGVADQFTPAGSFVFAGEVVAGRDALMHWFERSQPLHRRGKHIATNAIIDISGEKAVVTSDFLFFRFVKGVWSSQIAGRYRDVFAKIDGVWRLERREVEVLTALAADPQAEERHG